MSKMNCWEFMECQREPGGIKAGELGTCPAATVAVFDGINRGKNAGRACWACSGTLCGGKAAGTFASKFRDCAECAFYSLVRAEEDEKYVKTEEIMKKIADKD
jgi:broad specificity polyphosphatase/5'/3'-nucleotidase SurE